jgi:Flp pilus assembly protein TadD
MRLVPVFLLIDPSFRKHPNYRGLSRSAIEDGTADLRGVGLRFRVTGEMSWDPPKDATSLEQILVAGMRETRGPEDVLHVVLLGQRPRHADPTHLGFAFLGRPGLVVVVPPGGDLFHVTVREQLTLGFRHELGHVFGIPHLSGRNVMNPVLDRRVPEFDPLSLEILKACHAMRFGPEESFAGCDLATLRDVYLALVEQGEMENALLVNLGVALRRKGDEGGARDLFALALRRDPKLLEARFGLAQCAAAAGDSGEARDLVDGLAAESLTPEMRGVLGSLYLRLGDPVLAETLLTQAMAAHPRRFDFAFHRGLARFRLDRFAEAATDLEQALELEERPEAWYDLALAREALGEKAAAIRAYSRYLEMAPEGSEGDEARQSIERLRR